MRFWSNFAESGSPNERDYHSVVRRHGRAVAPSKLWPAFEPDGVRTSPLHRPLARSFLLEQTTSRFLETSSRLHVLTADMLGVTDSWLGVRDQPARGIEFEVPELHPIVDRHKAQCDFWDSQPY